MQRSYGSSIFSTLGNPVMAHHFPPYFSWYTGTGGLFLSTSELVAGFPFIQVYCPDMVLGCWLRSLSWLNSSGGLTSGTGYVRLAWHAYIFSFCHVFLNLFGALSWSKRMTAQSWSKTHGCSIFIEMHGGSIFISTRLLPLLSNHSLNELRAVVAVTV